MSSEKKCPHCGKWTLWNQKAEDRCQHCGGVLDERTVSERAANQVREEDAKASSFFTVRPTDRFPMIAVRKVAFVAHAVYAAIVWLFLMMFASTPG